MGGAFSGRRDGWPCTDEFLRLDVRRMQRDGYLQPGMVYSWQWGGKQTVNMRVEADQIRLNYRARQFGGEWQDMDYPARLERTPCNYGGVRVWFRCPVIGCGRRTAVLYGGRIFACRQCHRLSVPFCTCQLAQVCRRSCQWKSDTNARLQAAFHSLSNHVRHSYIDLPSQSTKT